MSIDDITKEASKEARERGEAAEAAKELQREAGDKPDTKEQFNEARREADWDQVMDHIEGGGKVER